jgi:poly-gamma-glutamate synthesis protein (capsule biosynthesis protein)
MTANNTERPQSTTIVFIGDVMLGRLVSEQIPHRSPDSFWGNTLPILQGADAVFANLECAITTHHRPWSRTPKVFHFGAVPEAIDVLKTGNISFVSLANNHVLDFEEAGFIDTLEHLDRAGIAHAGGGPDLAAARKPAMVNAGDLTLAVFAVTDNTPEFAATDRRPGTAYCDVANRSGWWPDSGNIAAARREGADIVVLSAHLGPNMVEQPLPRLRHYKQAMVERGNDIVHGHSAHNFQAVERFQQGLILHDTGDFLDDYAVDPILRNDWSFIFEIEICQKRLRRLRLYPVRLTLAAVNLAEEEDAGAILSRMAMLCDRFGTQFETSNMGFALDLET